MQKNRYITVISNRREIVLEVTSILYIITAGKNIEIHVSGGMVYNTRMGIVRIEKELGGGFIKIHRGCIVSSMAIHNVTDKVNLSNGESLEYTIRKKKEIIRQIQANQRNMIKGFVEGVVPITEAEYHNYYAGFENLPFAFTDIEMIFDDEKHAVDWIFRYGNQELAKLEKISLNKLIGSTFSSLFDNMDAKWLKNYERSALYGETLEMIDYSPEIDTYLKIISFPTFKGHCGCILFDISKIQFTLNNCDTEKALMFYLSNGQAVKESIREDTIIKN